MDLRITLQALSLVILLFSVIVHEVMHGWVALKFGDHTAERAGRLTLNPIPHIDPIGTILLPALLFISGSPILFGWAKPVPVNPLNFSNIRRGELLVSAAGIIANVCLAIVSAILFHILYGLHTAPLIAGLFLFGANINLLLAVFNLLPIPPLDGSKILMSQLPYNMAREFQKIEPFGPFILLALWFIPFGGTSLISFILGNATDVLRTLLFLP
jgi:Zn-dependent protease